MRFAMLMLAGWLLCGHHSFGHHAVQAAAPESVPEDMLRSHYRRRAHRALDQRLETYESLQTPEQIERWQQQLRTRLIESLGGLPEPTPLNARVVGVLERPDHRIEKILFESQPGFLVTANLYLPAGRGPFPGVLVPCGHSANGKAYSSYQKVCILLARNGCAALIYDPPGQGERKQMLKPADHDDHAAEGMFPATGEHMVTGVAPVLLGENLATRMIHDGRRAIDYLCSRPDIDPARIGCTGSSGGGNQTSFLMAIDERIVAAAPGNFITTTRIKNDRPGPGDAEQNIHGQIGYGLDHPDLILLRAPRPTLILAATQDFVPIEGTWIAFRQAKRIYTRLGYSERVDLAETDDRHGYNRELRVAMARFMLRWLRGVQDDITEPQSVDTLPDHRLQCTSRGQVLLEPGARSVFDLYQETARELKRRRQPRWAKMHESRRRSLVRRVAGIRELGNLPTPRPTVLSQTGSDSDTVRISSVYLRHDDDLVMPGELRQPAAGSIDQCVLLLADRATESGRQVLAAASVSDEPRTAVLSVDLAGLGQTTMKPWRYGSMSGVLGPNSAEWFVAYMLGESLVGLRSEQILLASRWLQQVTDCHRPVRIVAVGEPGVAALHAAAVEPDLIGHVTLRRSLHAWQSVIDTPVTRRQLPNVIHGVLRHYDLPDLAALLTPERLTVEQPVDAAGQPVSR